MALGLSPREQEIVCLLMQGCTSKQIALQLQVSHQTVRKHRENIMRKVGATNTPRLIALILSMI